MTDHEPIMKQTSKADQETPPQKKTDGALDDTDLASVAGGVAQFRYDAPRLSGWRQKAI